MVQLEQLKTRMKDSGMTMTSIADKMGITRGTLYNRLDGSSEFKVSEIVSLARLLHLSDKERNTIFFEA